MMKCLNKYGVNRCSVVTITMLLLIYVSATFDTHLFVYPSLSRSLISGLFVLLLTSVTLISCIVRKRSYLINKVSWFVLAWIIYIIIHYAIVNPHEEYKTTYLVASLLLIPTVSALLHYRLINRVQCETVILLVTVLHIIFVLAQWIGLVSSENIYFTLTGSNDNPTVTSLYLVGCVPVIVARLYHGGYRILYFCFLILCLVCIGALRCRTAYIGLTVELLVAIAMFFRKRKVRIPKSYSYPLLFMLLLTSVSAGSKLYDMKRDSADGRILIWKLSSKMIIEKPQGHGYGLFEKYYNLRQTDYFTNEISTYLERRNADHVITPYNDFLEHGVEGGVIGMALLIGFYVICIIKSFRQGLLTETSILCAYAVMSLTNFIVATIQPFLLIGSVVALLHAHQSCEIPKHNEQQIIAVSTISTIMFLLIGILVCRMVKITYAQMSLCEIRHLMNTGMTVDDSSFSEIEQNIATSEAFWNARAQNAAMMDSLNDSFTYLLKASAYSSTTQLYYGLGKICDLMKQKEKSRRFMKILSNMQPNRLYPKYELMKSYAADKETDSALIYANDIAEIVPKVKTDLSDKIQKDANIYISTNNEQKQ